MTMRTLYVARLAFLKLAGVKFNPAVAVLATASDVVWCWLGPFRHVFTLKQRFSRRERCGSKTNILPDHLIEPLTAKGCKCKF